MTAQRPGRRAPPDATTAQAQIEFLHESAEEQATDFRDEGRRSEWPIRAVSTVLIGAACTAWVASHAVDLAPSTDAPPHHITNPMSDQLPRTVTSAITRALPGISISGAAVRVAGTVASRTPGMVAGAVEARYRGFIIEVQIVPGTLSSGALEQTVTTGASEISVIHNRRRSALRSVTITAIAAGVAQCPTAQLQRMADALSRLPDV